jgi:DNA-binding transcriptional regulator YiaG
MKKRNLFNELDVIDLRERLHVSRAVFARYLPINVTRKCSENLPSSD